MSLGKAQQLEMAFERADRSMEELRDELLRHGGRVSEITLTRNRVSMVSVRFDATGVARVRMHVSFLGAPETVITALGRYLVKRSRHEWLVVRAYVAGKSSGDRTIDSGLLNADCKLQPQGRVYNLDVISGRMNQLYFNGKVVCGIGWGRMGTAKRGMARTRMIRFGSYSRVKNVIRVNPVLDDAEVPSEFVDYIVFHEMLHAAMPSVEHGVRRVHHHRAYRLMERRFPEHARMQKLAVELVGKLRGDR